MVELVLKILGIKALGYSEPEWIEICLISDTDAFTAFVYKHKAGRECWSM